MNKKKTVKKIRRNLVRVSRIIDVEYANECPGSKLIPGSIAAASLFTALFYPIPSSYPDEKILLIGLFIFLPGLLFAVTVRYFMLRKFMLNGQRALAFFYAYKPQSPWSKENHNESNQQFLRHPESYRYNLSTWARLELEAIRKNELPLPEQRIREIIAINNSDNHSMAESTQLGSDN